MGSDLPGAAWADGAEPSLQRRAWDSEVSALGGHPPGLWDGRDLPGDGIRSSGHHYRGNQRATQGRPAQGRSHIASGISPECGTQPSGDGGLGARNGERLWDPFLASPRALLAWVFRRPSTAHVLGDTPHHRTHRLAASRDLGKDGHVPSWSRSPGKGVLCWMPRARGEKQP